MKNRVSIILCIALLFSGCASVQTRLPVPDSAKLNFETTRQETDAFARYLKMRRRLDKVSAPILAANAELCEKTRHDFGITTHTKKSYPKHLREAAARRLAAGETQSVLFVRTGSPAQRAGITRGDVLLNKKGKPISALDDSLKTAKKITIRRAGKDSVINLEAKLVCDYSVRLKISGAVNAYANGNSITVTTAMMDFAKNDAELALVVGHELAHNTMGHVRKAIWNTVISGFATRTTRPFESEADYVGMYYMVRAGYKIDGVENFWRRLGVEHPRSIVRAKTHPVTPQRLLAIQLTAKEIIQKQAAGQKLLPNYKAGKAPNNAH